MPSKSCGCARCLERYPGERRPRRDCTGPWQARYRDADGKQKARNFETKKAAIAFLDEVRTDVRRGTYLDPKRGNITLGEWWEKWWPTQETKRVTTNNRKVITWRAHIEPKWGARPLLGLGYVELQAWIAKEVKGHVTQQKAIELLRAMLRDAVRDQRIPFNPAAELTKTMSAPAKHPDDLKPPTLEQYGAVRKVLPVWYQPLADFAQDTGMRWGEIIGLRRCWVDLGAETVAVREQLVDDNGRPVRQAAPKTSAGFRTVPLTPSAVAALEAMIHRLQPAATATGPEDGMRAEELVFRGPLAGRPRKAPDGTTFIADGVLRNNNFHQRVWQPAINEAGIARLITNSETGRKEWWPRFHDYRHALASRLHEAGVSEKDVQLILGQERGGRVTWIYTHGSEESVETVRRALAGQPVRRLQSVKAG